MTERVIAADGAIGLTAEDRWRERCLMAEARVEELEVALREARNELQTYTDHDSSLFVNPHRGAERARIAVKAANAALNQEQDG